MVVLHIVETQEEGIAAGVVHGVAEDEAEAGEPANCDGCYLEKK